MIMGETAEIVICDGCHWSFEIDDSGSEYCKRCRKMAAHLMDIGDKELRKKALAQLFNFSVLSALIVGTGIGVALALWIAK
jgi:hypothetical protein